MDRLRRLVRPDNTLILVFFLFAFSSAFPRRVIAQSNSVQTASMPQSSDQPSAAEPAADAPAPSFEVASVKKHVADPSGKMFMRLGAPPGDVSHWVGTNVTAKQLIAVAYNVKDFQIEGGPSWINSERFDIDAKVGDSEAAQLAKLPVKQQQQQMALMLRPLLTERFGLEMKRGMKEGTVLALVVAKGGPKLKEVPPPDPQAGPGPSPGPITPGHLPTPGPGQSYMMTNGRLATLASNAVPVANLVNQLSQWTGQQVVDQTGLKATYEYTLQFAPQNGPAGMPLPPGGPEAAPDDNTASIFTALQEQLGLKLESTKGSIDTITIDHIEEPSEN